MWVRVALRGPGVLLDAHVADYAIEARDGLSSDRKAALLANVHVRRLLRKELAGRRDCRRPWRRGMARTLAFLRDLCHRDGAHGEALRWGLESLWWGPVRPAWEYRRTLACAWGALRGWRGAALREQPA